jgi:hypothetical protein
VSQPTVNVTIVRPKRSATDWITQFLAGVAVYSLYGAILSWALSQVSALPSLGYIESVFVVVAARVLLADSSYTLWTRESK